MGIFTLCRDAAARTLISAIKTKAALDIKHELGDPAKAPKNS